MRHSFTCILIGCIAVSAFAGPVDHENRPKRNDMHHKDMHQGGNQGQHHIVERDNGHHEMPQHHIESRDTKGTKSNTQGHHMAKREDNGHHEMPQHHLEKRDMHHGGQQHDNSHGTHHMEKRNDMHHKDMHQGGNQGQHHIVERDNGHHEMPQHHSEKRSGQQSGKKTLNTKALKKVLL